MLAKYAPLKFMFLGISDLLDFHDGIQKIKMVNMKIILKR